MGGCVPGCSTWCPAAPGRRTRTGRTPGRQPSVRRQARGAGPIPRIRQRHPRRPVGRGRGAGRLPRRQARHRRGRRSPPPRPAGHRGAQRTQGRPALQDPAPAAGTARAPERQAGRPPGRRPDRRGPDLARSPSPGRPTNSCAPSTTHPPGRGPPPRRAGDRQPAHLPHPRARPPGPHAAGLATRSWPTSKPAACPTAAPRPSTASSKRPAAWPTAPATSTTTGYACSWPPTGNGPTPDAPSPSPHDHPQRRSASLRGMREPWRRSTSASADERTTPLSPWQLRPLHDLRGCCRTCEAPSGARGQERSIAHRSARRLPGGPS